ncbi:uncharacterized protein M6B38_157940 [Iris pallida]|uniref:Uncharacterized protein n=1 Tax=Iris pallida TaxID=29817 RepID=A0AAX6F0P3_IRIPA|nr:uncharacterized protein M6B38_157940 [Iris pallida]
MLRYESKKLRTLYIEKRRDKNGMIEMNGNLNSIYSIFGGPNSGRVRMLRFRIRTLDAYLVETKIQITQTELGPKLDRTRSEFCQSSAGSEQ